MPRRLDKRRPAGDPPETISGQDARQGRIVLNTPRRRWIFFGGLIAFVLFVIVAYALA